MNIRQLMSHAMSSLLVWFVTAAAVEAQVKGKISRNVYRIPYATTMAINVGGSDYVNHGGSMDTTAVHKVCTASAANPCSGNAGCASVGGTCQDGFCAKSCTFDAECAPNGGTCDYVLVAPADGIVCQIIEHYDDCGCNIPAFGPFGNNVAILHANAEKSSYLHIQQGSASLFGITPGMFVREGQPVALEGDVGRTCGNTAPARTGSCSSAVSVPDQACERAFPFVACDSDADCSGICTGSTCVGGTFSGQSCATGSDCADECKTTSCGRHVHWNITRFTTGEVVNPLTCGIPGNIYQTNSSQKAPCGTLPAVYASNATLAPTVWSGFGTFHVLQTHNTITAGAATVSNQASLVLHAGNKVTILPGFHVHSDGYFRAEIESPDITAASQRPIPGTCPCSNATEFCFQWSDTSSVDGVTMGCLTPGPDVTKCHGCAAISGGARCCGCIAANDCQP